MKNCKGKAGMVHIIIAEVHIAEKSQMVGYSQDTEDVQVSTLLHIELTRDHVLH